MISRPIPWFNEITEGLPPLQPEGRLLPNLAESWDNPEPLTYVYHLRKGVKFHDGLAAHGPPTWSSP
jgi:peptide/nickel transport system substrate-binding protein